MPRRGTFPRANRLEAELALAAASLLPRLDFIGNSMSFIAVELPSRSIVWKALAALDRHERGQPEDGNRCRLSRLVGAPLLDRAGQIKEESTLGSPACHRAGNVMVSHKQDQARTYVGSAAVGKPATKSTARKRSAQLGAVVRSRQTLTSPH